MFPNVLVANISNESFDNINQIIYDYMYKLNLRPALVHNLSTHTNEYHDNIRRGLKTTFTNKYISNIVLKELENVFKHLNLNFTIFGHQDLLQYSKGDEFKFHTDFNDS